MDNGLKALLMQKIESKITALESYINGSSIDFSIPTKFSLNWFVTLSEGRYERFSKSSRAIKGGTALNKRILGLLNECEARRKKGDPKVQSNDKELQGVIKKLKVELENTKKERDAQAEENIELRRQLIDSKKKNQIFQAQIRDQNTNRKIISLEGK
ncbi:hypothetical protein SAMN02745753_04071 [Marinomonas polaris DSM 16579]|jgi:5'-3' exonuclease|uniref:Uncharacterized protein n=1 Tax=Marinomonas polaris DSM 16579 TaxID=1122206 RepID=A0A1M5KJU6_9GAMM|nr:hypothetical protein [Marinomonas polaris]SHG52443.1 hypothetical protein SAMN02745753_04071 [Marinomonas polaris DSM 16579]